MSVSWSARVRYVECDQQGVAFNAHYLTWADETSTDWWASMGFPWEELVTLGGEPMVRASTLEWTSAARFGDVVTVDGSTESVGRTSVVARFVVRVDDRVCCTVRTTYVWVTPDGAQPWPDAVRAALVAD